LGAVFAGEAAEVEESPAGSFAADAGVFGGIEKSGAHFLHADVAQELHGRAALSFAERILQSAGVDAGSLTDISERKWKMGVGAHVLRGVIELPRSGAAAAIEQARVVVGLSLKQELHEFVLELAQRDRIIDAMVIGAVEDAAELAADGGEALPGSGFQAKGWRESESGVDFARKNLFELSDHGIA